MTRIIERRAYIRPPTRARSVGSAPLRLLTWNLFHGRAEPAAGRPLLDDFAAAIANSNWDVALLQEVPPWWPATLARRAGADQCTALTSRNAALPARRAIAERWPDLIKSNGGGANAILSRVAIRSHEAIRIRLWPERRVAQIVRLEGGVRIVNLHASRDAARARSELAGAFGLTGSGGPAVVGGDFNTRAPELPAGFAHLAGHGVDHVCGRELASVGRAELLDVALSDHRALLCEFS